MKSIKLLNLLLFCATIFCLSGCSDDESGPAWESIPEGSMSMLIDGEKWESTIVSGVSVSGINSYTAINGFDSNLSLTMEGNIVGTYKLGGEEFSSLTFADNTTGRTYITFEEDNASGEIVISETSLTQKTISGSFNAIVLDSDGETKTITDGLFHEISYE